MAPTWTTRTATAAVVAATLPVAVWVKDTVGGFCRVRGDSMQPALHDGDVVVVRKCDPGTVIEFLRELFSVVGAADENDVNTSGTNSNSRRATQQLYPRQRQKERARLLRYEFSEGVYGGGFGPMHQHYPKATSRLYDCPPLALRGHIVVYRNPISTYPKQEMCVKRVIGVGGQYVRYVQQERRLPPQRSTSGVADADGDENARINYPNFPFAGKGRGGYRSASSQIVSIPPYSIFVEGDNAGNSVDSRLVGPIPKGLLVGVAEYVVWPPSRWQRIRNDDSSIRNDDATATATTGRAYWP